MLGAGWLTGIFKRNKSRPSPEELNDYLCHTHLDNGIQIASQRRDIDLDKKLRFHFLVDVGSNDDPIGQEGIAHFLEHLLITKEEQSIFRRQKGDINASTAGSKTSVYGYLENTPENLEFLIKFLAKIPTAEIEDKDFNRQKTRILNEIGMCEDNLSSMNKRCIEKSFVNEKGAPGVLGGKETVSSIDIEDIKNFKNRWYVGQNICIAVTGVNDHEEFHRFMNVEMANVSGKNSPERYERKFRSVDLRESKNNLMQLHFSLNYPIQGLNPRQKAIAKVAEQYLYEMMRERIQRQKGLVYDIYTLFLSDPKQEGHLSITGNVLPEDADKIMPEIAAVLAQATKEIDSEMFDVVYSETLGEIQDRKSKYRYSWYDPEDMINDIIEQGRPVTWQEKEGMVQTITSREVHDFIAATISQRPSIIAYGDSSKLHSLDEFIDMLEKEKKNWKAAPTAVSENRAPIIA